MTDTGAWILRALECLESSDVDGGGWIDVEVFDRIFRIPSEEKLNQLITIADRVAETYGSDEKVECDFLRVVSKNIRRVRDMRQCAGDFDTQ